MHLATINKTYSRLLALVILLLISIWIWTSKDVLVKEKQIYQVNHGASIGTVAKDLGDKKWINSELFFNSLSKLLGVKDFSVRFVSKKIPTFFFTRRYASSNCGRISSISSFLVTSISFL